MKKRINLTTVWNRYKKNEENNDHSENVVLLAKTFGTDEDVIEAEDIQYKHDSIGYITTDLLRRRDILHNKLYPLLVRLVK